MIALVRGIAGARLEAACVHLVNKMRENVSVAGRTKTQVTVSRGKNKGKTRTKWGALNSKPSAPGDFPAKQTGKFRSSIAYTVDKQTLSAKVGTSLKYGKFLEMGTRKMAPRPWLLRTAGEEKQAVNQIMAGK